MVVASGPSALLSEESKLNQCGKVGSKPESLRLATNLRNCCERYVRTSKSIIAGKTPEALHRLKQTTDSFHAEVQHLTDAPEIEGQDDTSDQPFEILNKSLLDANKRCQDFNTNMLQVADVNSELVDTLTSLRHSNQTLQDQLDGQLAEVTALTESCIADQLNIEREKCRGEEDRLKRLQEGEKEMVDLESNCDDAWIRMDNHHASKWKCSEEKLREIVSVVRDLGATQKATTEEISEFVLVYADQQRKTTNEVRTGIEKLGRHRKLEVERLTDVVRNLQVKLTTENEQRKLDSQSSEILYESEIQEKNELDDRLTRDSQGLRARLEELLDEREANEKKKQESDAKCIDGIDSNNVKRDTYRLKIEDLEVHVEKAMLRCIYKKDSIEFLTEEVENLKQEIQNSNKLMTVETSTSKKLRSEISRHRVESMRQHEADISENEHLYEQKFASENERAADCAKDIATKVKEKTAAMMDISNEDSVVARSYDAIIEDRIHIQRDLSMTKSVCDANDKAAEEVRKLYQRCKQESENELTMLADTCEDMETRTNRAMVLLDEKHQEVNEYVGNWNTKNDKHMEYMSTVQQQLAESTSCYQETKEALKETSAIVAYEMRSEAAIHSAGLQAMEELSRKSTAIQEDQALTRSKLQREHNECKRENEKLGFEFARMKDVEGAEFQRMKEGPHKKYCLLESQIADIQQQAKQDEIAMSSQLAASRSELSALEHEFTHLEEATQESHKQVETQGRALLKLQEEIECAKERFAKELDFERRALEKSVGIEKAEKERLSVEEKKQETEFSILSSDLDNAKRELQAKIEDLNKQARSVVTQFSESKEQLVKTFNEEAEQDKSHMDEIIRENRSLRNSIAHENLRKEYPAVDANSRYLDTSMDVNLRSASVIDRDVLNERRSTSSGSAYCPTVRSTPMHRSHSANRIAGRMRTTTDLADHLIRLENRRDEHRYSQHDTPGRTLAESL